MGRNGVEMRIVQKYGGSSVATIAQIKNIAKHIKKNYLKNELVVVVSAMGKTTNGLIDLAKQVNKDPNKRDLDFLLNVGEMQSAALLSMALNSLKVPTVCLTGWQAGIKTNSNFGKCFIEKVDVSRIENLLAKNKVVVVTGFQGEWENELTTLGRGGSDTTAVALASCLRARCEIYTDVDGIYFANPNEYKNVKQIKRIDYDSMLALATCGTKVLDYRCLEIAKKYNVEILLNKTLNKDGGSIVGSEYFESLKVTGVSALKGFVEFEITSGAYDKIMLFIKSQGANIDYFEINGKNIYLLCKEENKESLEKSLNKSKIKFSTRKGFAKLTIGGNSFVTHGGAVLSILQAFKQNNIFMEHFYVSETAIFVLLFETDCEKAVKAVIEVFGGEN